jgi:flagellar capping protein FliD
VLAGDANTQGAIDVMRDLVNSFTQTGDGLLAQKRETLDSRAKSLDSSVNREQDRLDRYAEQLRKQFTTMDSTVAGYNAQLDYLVRLYNGG